MAWSLANEPRCNGDYSGATLQVHSRASIPLLAPLHLHHRASCIAAHPLTAASCQGFRELALLPLQI